MVREKSSENYKKIDIIHIMTRKNVELFFKQLFELNYLEN